MRTKEFQFLDCQISTETFLNSFSFVYILIRIFEKKRKVIKRYFESKKYKYSMNLMNSKLAFLATTLAEDNFWAFKEICFLCNWRKDICSFVHRLNVKRMSNKLTNSSLNLSIRKISRKETYFEREITASSHHKPMISTNLKNIVSWRLWNTNSNSFKNVNIKLLRNDENIKSKIKTSVTIMIKEDISSSSSTSSNFAADTTFSILNSW